MKWVDVAKTGRGRELAPYDEDWLFIRASAIIRHLYIRPDQGVGALRNVYGNKKRRGAAPGHHVKASGGLIRYCLQQLESLGLLEKTKTGY
jgi:small subunit ribosomal protein S19e